MCRKLMLRAIIQQPQMLRTCGGVVTDWLCQTAACFQNLESSYFMNPRVISTTTGIGCSTPLAYNAIVPSSITSPGSRASRTIGNVINLNDLFTRILKRFGYNFFWRENIIGCGRHFIPTMRGPINGPMINIIKIGSQWKGVNVTKMIGSNFITHQCLNTVWF